MEYTEEQREYMLKQQRAASAPGTITYERGLEVMTSSGLICAGTDGYILYADSSALIQEQQRWFIPLHRIVSVEFDA